jgi:hypothetical protein
MITKTTYLFVLCFFGLGLNSFNYSDRYNEEIRSTCLKVNDAYTYSMTYHNTLTKEVENEIKSFLLSRKGISSCEINSQNKTISFQTEREMIQSDVDHLFHSIEHRFLEN